VKKKSCAGPDVFMTWFMIEFWYKLPKVQDGTPVARFSSSAIILKIYPIYAVVVNTVALFYELKILYPLR